jgi:hypothetical protein
LSEPPETSIKDLFGLVTCQVLPPDKLHIPVLPARFDGKLYFPLCQTCMTERNLDYCEHSDADRMLTGTWHTPELELALEYGYQITRCNFEF